MEIWNQQKQHVNFHQTKREKTLGLNPVFKAMDDAARRGEDVSGLDISTEPVKQTVTVPEAKDPRQREWGFKNTVFGRTKKDLHTHTYIYIYTHCILYICIEYLVI